MYQVDLAHGSGYPDDVRLQSFLELSANRLYARTIGKKMRDKAFVLCSKKRSRAYQACNYNTLYYFFVRQAYLSKLYIYD